MSYFEKEYNVMKITTVLHPYFMSQKVLNKIKYEKLILKPKMSSDVSSTLNNLFSIEYKEKLFPHKFIDLIIIKDGFNEKPPFNNPDFYFNQLIMFWCNKTNSIQISQTGFKNTDALSFIDIQIYNHEKLKYIMSQCINNIAEICKDIVPQEHRTLKELKKGNTIKFNDEFTHKFKIPQQEKKDNKCVLCLEYFTKDTNILYPCDCNSAYHLECYSMNYRHSISDHSTRPNCCGMENRDYCRLTNTINLVNKFKECYDTNTLNTIEFIYCIDCKINNIQLPARISNTGLNCKIKYYKPHQ